MKELTLEILEKALEDWKKPIKQCYKNNTGMGLCGYFYFQHKIDCYGFNKSNAPWVKYATLKKSIMGYHFNRLGNDKQGRLERVNAIKGMIKDLKAKQNGKQ